MAASGVGPKLALAILSVHSPAALRRAVAEGDLDALTLVPGVGKRTAQRLMIELAAKLGTPAATHVARRRRPRRAGRGPGRPRRPRLRRRRGAGGAGRPARRRARRGDAPGRPQAPGPDPDPEPDWDACAPAKGAARALSRCSVPGPTGRGGRGDDACGPAAWPSSSASPPSRSTWRSSSGRPSSAGRPSTTCSSPAPRAWARPPWPGIVAAEMGVGMRITSGPGAGALRGPGRHPHQPRRGRRPLHRRDPPPAPDGGGGPLPRHGGLRPRHRHRQGPVGPLDPARPAPLHPGGRHHPHRAHHRPAAGPLRLRGPARLLRRRRPGGHRGAGRRHPGGPARPRGRRGDRPAGPGDAPHRQPPAAPGARLRRGPGRRRGRPGRRPPTPWPLFEVDERGLDKVDRAILGRAVPDASAGTPVGLSTLAVSVGEEPETVEDVYEPYLLKEGFLQRTPRGRVATAAAFAHLGLHAAGARTRQEHDPVRAPEADSMPRTVAAVASSAFARRKLVRHAWPALDVRDAGRLLRAAGASPAPADGGPRRAHGQPRRRRRGDHRRRDLRPHPGPRRRRRRGRGRARGRRCGWPARPSPGGSCRNPPTCPNVES